MYFAVAQRMDRLEQIRSDHIEPIKLDVTDEEAVSRTVNHVISTKGGLMRSEQCRIWLIGNY